MKLQTQLSFAVILNSDLFDIKILMAILNSKITTFYHFNSSPKATKGAFPKILVEDIRNFPLPIISNSVKIKITDMVEKIILNKKNNIPSKQFEKQIDLMVYKIYQLSYDEVLIVEPEFEMSREDYEKFKI